MKQSKLIAAIAMASVAGTMIGCSRFKGNAGNPAPSAQALAHKGDQCPMAGSYIEAGDDGKPGDRRIEIIESNGVFGIVEYDKGQQDLDRTFQVKNEDEATGEDSIRLAKCSGGSIVVSYMYVGTRESSMDVKYEGIEGGKALRVTTTLPLEGKTSVVTFVKKMPNTVGEEGDMQISAPVAPSADPSAPTASTAQAPAALAPAGAAPLVAQPPFEHAETPSHPSPMPVRTQDAPPTPAELPGTQDFPHGERY